MLYAINKYEGFSFKTQPGQSSIVLHLRTIQKGSLVLMKLGLAGTVINCFTSSNNSKGFIGVEMQAALGTSNGIS
jgi:hypothetical protein